MREHSVASFLHRAAALAAVTSDQGLTMQLLSLFRRIAALPACSVLLGCLFCGATLAQDTARASSRPELGGAPYRRLAPGVETTIPPNVRPADTVLWRDIPSILTATELKWTPNYIATSRTLHGKATNAQFQREIWCLEFTFKPLRMIYVDVPQPSGKMQRKLIWYLVFRVKNTGVRLKPVFTEDGFETAKADAKPARYVPNFVLESHERTAAGERIYKAYLDRIIPKAIEAIRQREDPNRELLSAVEMSGREIPLSQGKEDLSVWGVATWEDVDPKLDFFSIYAGGLTNAFTWEDPPGQFRKGDPPGKGRKLFAKTLQLNFWRPGDEIRQHEQEIRFGVPRGMAELYDSEEGVAYQWVYR